MVILFSVYIEFVFSFLNFIFNWSIIALQCCISFRYTSKWISFVVVVQSLSHVWLFVTPWTATHQASHSFTISQSLLKVMPIELMMPSNHLIPSCCPLLLLPSIFPSIWVFSNESALHIRWPKFWSFSIVLPVNIHGWFPLGLTDLILLSKGLSRVFSNTTVQKH